MVALCARLNFCFPSYSVVRFLSFDWFVMAPTRILTPSSSTAGSSPLAKPSAALAAASEAIVRRAAASRRSPTPALSLAPPSTAAPPSPAWAAPPLSSRSAGSSGGFTGYAKGKLSMYFLRARTRSSVCLGLVKDTNGFSTRACNDGIDCGIQAHADLKSKFEGFGDAYYAPAKKKSFVIVAVCVA